MKTNWKSLKTETVVFLALTFGLTFLLNFVMLVNFDLFAENQELLNVAIRFEMLIPAFSAIILNLFVFRSKAYPRKPKIFFLYFLVITAFTALLFVIRLGVGLGLQHHFIKIFGNLIFLVANLLALGWLALIAVWHFKAEWRKELKTAKLSFGKPAYYLLFSLFFFGYFAVSTILNCSFSLGSPPSEQAELGSLLLGFATVILGPIIAFPQLFGEEYAWRIFLQDRLIQQYGRIKAVLLVGLVWGLWHAPMVAGFGWTYPGYPVLGILLFTILAVEMSIPLGLAVFKSKSVWLVVFVHGVIDNGANYLSSNFCMPSDIVYSFGVGIYGLLIFGVITLAFLKSKEWKEPA